jgi:hypothetical protein
LCDLIVCWSFIFIHSILAQPAHHNPTDLCNHVADGAADEKQEAARSQM